MVWGPLTPSADLLAFVSYKKIVWGGGLSWNFLFVSFYVFWLELQDHCFREFGMFPFNFGLWL